MRTRPPLQAHIHIHIHNRVSLPDEQARPQPIALISRHGQLPWPAHSLEEKSFHVCRPLPPYRLPLLSKACELGQVSLWLSETFWQSSDPDQFCDKNVSLSMFPPKLWAFSWTAAAWTPRQQQIPTLVFLHHHFLEDGGVPLLKVSVERALSSQVRGKFPQREECVFGV